MVDIQLPSDSSSCESALIVFRQGEVDFRLVTSTKQVDTLVTQHDKDIDVDMARDRLVPAYGNPFSSSSPRHNLLIYNYQGKKPKEFAFSNREEAEKLQRALTDYRVHHDMPVSRWCINASKKPAESGVGVLQLWQFKPLPPLEARRGSTASAASSLDGDPLSPVSSLRSRGARTSDSSYKLRKYSSAVSGKSLTSQTSVMSASFI